MNWNSTTSGVSPSAGRVPIFKFWFVCLLSAGLFLTTLNVDTASARHRGAKHHNEVLGGAVAGAIIGGIINGRSGARAGLLVGGIAGAVQRSERRKYRKWRERRWNEEQWRRRRW